MSLFVGLGVRRLEALLIAWPAGKVPVRVPAAAVVRALGVLLFLTHGVGVSRVDLAAVGGDRDRRAVDGDTELGRTRRAVPNRVLRHPHLRRAVGDARRRDLPHQGGLG